MKLGMVVLAGGIGKRIGRPFQKQFLEVHALQPMTGSAADLGRFLDAESEKWAKLIRDTNLTVD